MDGDPVIPRCFHRERGHLGHWINMFFSEFPADRKLISPSDSDSFGGATSLRPVGSGTTPDDTVLVLLETDVVVLDVNLRPSSSTSDLLNVISGRLGADVVLAPLDGGNRSAFVVVEVQDGVAHFARGSCLALKVIGGRGNPGDDADPVGDCIGVTRDGTSPRLSIDPPVLLCRMLEIMAESDT